MRRSIGPFALAFALSLATSAAEAAGPYVVVTDTDGFVEGHALKTNADVKAIQDRLVDYYTATGSELPEVMSVWTTFPFAGSPIGTYFLPLGLHVTGIGIDQYYPPTGTLTSKHPPIDAILIHNDVTVLPARAAKMSAPEEGFASYLFLLELSHRFGPALRVPGADQNELTGFPFHWSFWMDAGGSPSGGNKWKDNGDGTFTTITPPPSKLLFSMLDLYAMGLASKAEVQPFGVLEGAVPPAGVIDPLWGGEYAAHSFPWFDATTPFTVPATRRAITIDDVITATGERDPAVGDAPSSWKLGIMLLVSSKDTPGDVDAAKAIFDPVSAALAPAFHTATSDRGTLVVVTPPPEMGTGGAGGAGGAGAGGTGGSGGSGGAAASADESGCGCRAAGVEAHGAWWGLAAAAIVASRRRRRERKAA